MVCGLSGYSVSLFHLTNHAFFKALLFLSAGSVIHAISDEQDLRKMDSDLVSASDEFKKRKFYLKYYWNCCFKSTKSYMKVTLQICIPKWF